MYKWTYWTHLRETGYQVKYSVILQVTSKGNTWERVATAAKSDGKTYHERQKGKKQPLLEVLIKKGQHFSFWQAQRWPFCSLFPMAKSPLLNKSIHMPPRCATLSLLERIFPQILSWSATLQGFMIPPSDKHVHGDEPKISELSVLTTHTIADLPETPIPIFSNSPVILRNQIRAGMETRGERRGLLEDDEPVNGG